MHSSREKERKKETDRQTDKQTGKSDKSDRHTNIQVTQTDGEIDKHNEIQRTRVRDRHAYREQS